MTKQDWDNKKFTAWRNRVKEHFPVLASRVFALRGKHYMGCGGHYEMERKLGYVINSVNDYHKDFYHGKDAIANRIMLELAVEMLFSDVYQAEQSFKTLRSKYRDLY